MGQNYLDIIVFAVVAAVIIFKIIRVLGTRVDGEPTADDFMRGFTKNQDKPGADSADNDDETPNANVVDVEPITVKDEKLMAFSEKWQQIKAIDPSFEPERFIKGAERAFEMILNAYVGGDKDVINRFVVPDLAKFLIQVMDKRTQDGLTQEKKFLIGLNASEVKLVDIINESKVYIEVLFESEQIFALYDVGGRCVEGDPSQLLQKSDTWVFTKDIKDKSPIWYLTEIKNN